MGDIFNTFAYHVHQRMHKDGRPMPFGFITLGLVGEGGELTDACLGGPGPDQPPELTDIISELGDVLWYLEAVVQSKQLAPHFGHIDYIADGQNVFHHYCKVAELAKKDSWHGKPADPEKLKYHLGAILTELSAVCSFWGFTLETAMKQNIEKLEKRYPMGIFVEGGGVR